MTTIAFDGKCLAADSRGGGGFIEPVEYQKIFDCGEFVVAGSGNWAAVQRWVDWFQAGADKADYPDWGDRLSGVFVVSRKTGLMQVWGPGDPHPSVDWHSGPNALGSGEEFAMGAMLAGATASEAVEIASRLDPHTGGPIRVVWTEASGER